MKNLIAFFLLLTLCFLNINAQEEESETRLMKVKVIDEVRYLLLRNAEFRLYNGHGETITFESYENISFVNDKEVFDGYQIYFSGFVDSLTIEVKVEGYTYIDTTLVLHKEKFKKYGKRYVSYDEIQLKTTLEPYKELGEVAVNATIGSPLKKSLPLTKRLVTRSPLMVILPPLSSCAPGRARTRSLSMEPADN